jgi:hypothetical protein
MADWHPIMTARELTPGIWHLVDAYERPHSIVRIIRRGDEVGYRADTCPRHGGAPRLIGYFTNLRAAAGTAHTWHIASLSPLGGPMASHTSAPPPVS